MSTQPSPHDLDVPGGRGVPIVFPGDHGGFMADPAAFAGTIRQVLIESRGVLQPARQVTTKVGSGSGSAGSTVS